MFDAIGTHISTAWNSVDNVQNITTSKKKWSMEIMPETKKFRKMKRAMIQHYGKKKGTQVAHATAQKQGWRH